MKETSYDKLLVTSNGNHHPVRRDQAIANTTYDNPVLCANLNSSPGKLFMLYQTLKAENMLPDASLTRALGYFQELVLAVESIGTVVSLRDLDLHLCSKQPEEEARQPLHALVETMKQWMSSKFNQRGTMFRFMHCAKRHQPYVKQPKATPCSKKLTSIEKIKSSLNSLRSKMDHLTTLFFWLNDPKPATKLPALDALSHELFHQIEQQKIQMKIQHCQLFETMKAHQLSQPEKVVCNGIVNHEVQSSHWSWILHRVLPFVSTRVLSTIDTRFLDDQGRVVRGVMMDAHHFSDAIHLRLVSRTFYHSVMLHAPTWFGLVECNDTAQVPHAQANPTIQRPNQKSQSIKNDESLLPLHLLSRMVLLRSYLFPALQAMFPQRIWVDFKLSISMRRIGLVRLVQSDHSSSTTKRTLMDMTFQFLAKKFVHLVPEYMHMIHCLNRINSHQFTPVGTESVFACHVIQ